MLRAPHHALPSPAATLARRLGVLVTAIASTCLLLVVGCGDDDDSNPTGPGRDSTVPRIASVMPIADDTAVDDGTDSKAPAASAYRRGSGTSVVMEFEPDLPPSSTITIVITTDATSITGEPLEQETVFGFTTGDAADVTPPELVSVEPANGTSVDPATSTIVFTFGEPIDTARFEPSTIGGQLLLLLDAIDDRIDVRGTADPWPVVDGRTQTWRGFETVTEGDGSPRFEGYGFTRSFEERADGSVYVRDFHDDPPAEADEWDVFERDGNAVWYLGYGELDEGTPVEVRFADRATWLPLPPIPAAGWSGDTTTPFGDVTASLHYSGAVVSREDLSLEPITTVDGGPIGPVVVWSDCWKVSLQYVIRDGPTSLLEGDATLWHAPGVGLVREDTDEWDHVEDRVATYDEWLFTFADDGGSGAKARR